MCSRLLGGGSCLTTADRDAIIGADWAELRHVVEPLAGGQLKFLGTGSGDNDTESRMALRCLVRHAVSRVAPNAHGPVFGVVPVPARASDLNRKTILNAVSGILDACLLVPSPVATAYGLGQLTRTLVVDVGAGTVDMAVFDEEGKLPHYTDQITLPTGLARTDRAFADAVLKQVGIGLSLDQAREMRERHGSAKGHVAGAVSRRNGEEPVCVSACLKQACRSLVTSITTALQELAQGGSRKPETVILTGGGSLLTGIDAVARDILDRPVSLGRPIGLAGLKKDMSGPDFTTLAGTIAFAERRLEARHAVDVPATLPGRVGRIVRLGRWLRENF